MLTYVYKCKKCGHIFEEFQSITAKPLTKCKQADCTGTVQRVISAGAGILFKGSGFYQTDYRSESYKKGANAEKPSPPSESPKSDSSTKSEAKPSEKKADSTKSQEP
jgi:putative FmdB family regulatory protein